MPDVRPQFDICIVLKPTHLERVGATRRLAIRTARRLGALLLMSALPASAHGVEAFVSLGFTLIGMGTLLGLLLAAFVPGRALTKVAAVLAAVGGGAGCLLAFVLGALPPGQVLPFVLPLVIPAVLALLAAIVFRPRSQQSARAPQRTPEPPRPSAPGA